LTFSENVELSVQPSTEVCISTHHTPLVEHKKFQEFKNVIFKTLIAYLKILKIMLFWIIALLKKNK